MHKGWSQAGLKGRQQSPSILLLESPCPLVRWFVGSFVRRKYRIVLSRSLCLVCSRSLDQWWISGVCGVIWTIIYTAWAPEGREGRSQLEVGARRAPKLLVTNIFRQEISKEKCPFERGGKWEKFPHFPFLNESVPNWSYLKKHTDQQIVHTWVV